MKRFLKVAAVAVIAVGVVAGCGPNDDKSASSNTASPTAASPSKPKTTKTPEAAASVPKSDGRMVWLDRLSVPKMEGWEYGSPEEGKADRDAWNDAFLDTQGCTGAALEISQCPRVIVADEAASLKFAKEAGFGDLLKNMSMDQMAEMTLCKRNPATGIKPRKPEGTDNIDGVIAYRYHATLKDCGIDIKPIPLFDPKFKGGSTLWIIKTNKEFISIYATDSGAKDMVKYIDVNKLRYALTHGKWIG